MTETIKIPFNQREKEFLAFVFVEVFGGGSTRAIQAVLGESVEKARSLEPVVRRHVNNKCDFIELTESQWRVMYESVHAVVYGLGPFELQTCTGHDLHDACNLNLRICAHVWGVYQGDTQWPGTTTGPTEK